MQAQVLQRPFRKLGTRDGLPQSFITGLVQDREGFVWVSTLNGLARYDGRQFRLFQFESGDTASLASNLIFSMKTDRHNQLWIVHQSYEIDRLDPVTEKIERISSRALFRSHPIKFMRKGWLADASGNLWLTQVSNGIYRYDWKSNSISHFTYQSKNLAGDSIRGLLEDKQRQLWLIDQHYLSRFDKATGSFIAVPIPYQLDFTAYAEGSAETAVYERANGEIMFGDRQRLVFYNPRNKSFRTLPLLKYADLGIRVIQPGPGGEEYFESAGIVYRYDDVKGIMAVGDIGMTQFRDAVSFMTDRSGLIWLGTNAAGIQQIDLSTPFFESHPVTKSFHYDVLKEQLGVQLDRFSGWSADKQFVASSYYFRSAYDTAKRLWLALRSSIAWYDAEQQKITRLPDVPGISDPVNVSSGIRGIGFGTDGKLWVISDKGYIAYYDALHHEWAAFLDLVRMRNTNPNFIVNDLLVDGDKLWVTIAGGEGLLRIDCNTKQVLQLNSKTYPRLFPTDMLLKIQPDPTRTQLIWIGTYQGLVCFNKEKLTSEVFSVKQGLPDNTIYSILTDKAGYLWLSTNKGLCRFHPVSHELRLFKTSDGLLGEEFNRFHDLKLPDGRLAFGGMDGWVLFDPAMIKDDNYNPPVAFTAFKINNETAALYPGKTIPGVSLNNMEQLVLPYDKNTLSFEFAGLEFNKPQKLLYRYQLQSYDDKWIMANAPVANYTKLPPGRYILNINSSNSTGQWSSVIQSLTIIIKPPFWLTWWALTFYVLLLVGLVWAYIRYRLNRERMLQQVFLKEREAIQLKAVDELKTRFFSNITHEFRTPLTLILTPAQRLKQTLQQSDQLRWLGAIERNAHQLLRLINQLLDFSKLESGTLVLNETRASLQGFVEELLRSFYEEAASNGIQLEFNSNAAGEYWFDADKLEQVVRNLVANALKFTPSGGKVMVSLDTGALGQDKKADRSIPIGIVLTVRDTGIGIPPDQLPYVFNRFYQVDNFSSVRSAAPQQKGSGIGLALVKEMAELQGGKIEVKSQEETTAGDWSTVFTIWLPYRKLLAPDLNDPVNSQISPVQYQPYIPKPATDQLPATDAVTILIVEDNPELAEFIADSLPAAYKTVRASNGAEGLEKAIELIPDLVISDVLMPVMDGFECCHKIKQDERTNHIPVILLTAKASFDNRIEGLTLGADDYLTKPFHIQELQLRVHNLLDRQRILREKLHQELSLGSTAAPAESSQPVVQDPFILKLYDIIEARLDDSLFGVQELVTELGMSRTSLYRKLKALTDMPAGDIIRNYRLKRALHFLKDGLNSSETAYRVGFDSPAYFSKCFREFYNITPLEYTQKGL